MSIQNHSKKSLSLLLMAAGVIAIISIVFFYSLVGTISPSNGFPLPIADCVDVNRAAYGITSGVFSELPPPPKCLLSVAEAFRNGNISDAVLLDARFFSQPEFYSSFFTQGLGFWKNPISTHYGAIGLGSLPVSKSIFLSKGQSKTVRLFIHSGFGVRTFQAVRMVPAFENSADENAVKIFLDSGAQKGFVLAPGFPKFGREWARAVDVNITISATAPSKLVRVVLQTSPLSSEDFSSLQTLLGATPLYDATDYVGNTPLSTFVLQIQ